MFVECLKQSYSNDTIFRIIEKKDALNPYDGLDLNDIGKARMLAKILIKELPSTSKCDGCLSANNYYMATCLHYYKSKQLDSIAKVQYKNYKKRQAEIYR